MKLKTAGILTAVSVMFMGANANANLLFDVYTGATIGAGGIATFANGTDHTDSAQSYGAVLGLDIPLMRFELEYDYLNNQDIKLHVGMINAYVKMPTAVVKPYLGVGIGSVFDGELANNVAKIDTTTAYQAMLVLTFDIPVLPINVDVEGRALYAPDLFEVTDTKPDVLHYDLRLKLRYVF